MPPFHGDRVRRSHAPPRITTQSWALGVLCVRFFLLVVRGGLTPCPNQATKNSKRNSRNCKNNPAQKEADSRFSRRRKRRRQRLWPRPFPRHTLLRTVDPPPRGRPRAQSLPRRTKSRRQTQIEGI